MDPKDYTVQKVITAGPDLDNADWLETNGRFALLHNGRTVAVSLHDGVPYVDRMMALYTQVAGLTEDPPNGELEVVRVSLDFHVGDRVSLQYEGVDYTGQVAHVVLQDGDDGKVAYVLEGIEPAILLEAGYTLAGTADELTLAR